MAERRILVFGDSNTYGWMPVTDGPPSRRFAAETRWPGVLRAALGDGYEVIEDGLSGRTTDAADSALAHIPGAGMDGAAALPGAIAAHLPLDLVVLMLGTNDLKLHLGRSALRIAIGAARLIDAVQTANGGVGTDYPNPNALLICPPPIGRQGCFYDMFGGAETRSRQLAPLYRSVAALAGVGFLDAGEVIETDGADGIHLSGAMHLRLGNAVAAKVRSVLD